LSELAINRPPVARPLAQDLSIRQYRATGDGTVEYARWMQLARATAIEKRLSIVSACCAAAHLKYCASSLLCAFPPPTTSPAV